MWLEQLNKGGGPARLRGKFQERLNFGPNPGHLQMLTYCPRAAQTGAPLLVILHGCGQSAEDYDQGTGWSAAAERFGFVLLAPQQTTANNFNRCFNWFLPEHAKRGNGEAESIHQMILAATREFSIDSSRVYITGLSAGGAMTSVMLAAYPELFAGGAIIAGLPYGSASNLRDALNLMRQSPATTSAVQDAVRGASRHAGPWPRISVWHGEADEIVSPANMEAILAQWIDVHAPARPPVLERHQNWERRQWQDGAGTPVIEACKIAGLGHGVPIVAGKKNSYGKSGAFFIEAGISSTARIAGFFALDVKTGTRAGAQSRRKSPAGRPTPAIQTAPARVHSVIVSALRACGLMGP